MTLALLKQDLPYTLDDEVEAAARLASQWPKRCAVCLKVYDLSVNGKTAGLDVGTWENLKLVGGQSDRYGYLEFRDCGCRNTLTVLTKIYAVEEE